MGSLYSTARWQRLRKAILKRDNYTCAIRGPRCRGVATTVHHRTPSSEAPELFWDPGNLCAACTRCNYGDGTRIANRNRRRTIDELEDIIRAQHQRIHQLHQALTDCERARRRQLQSS